VNPKRRKLRLGICLSITACVIIVGYFGVSKLLFNHQVRAAFPAPDKVVLESSEQFTLYSLDPYPLGQGDVALPIFHEHRILGKTLITDPKIKRHLLDAMYESIGNSNGDMAACFNPRHGIHAVSKQKTVDLVICFECGQTEVYDEHGMHGTTNTSSPKPVFDRVLTNAGVTLTAPEK
jgi:hypothetical protein